MASALTECEPAGSVWCNDPVLKDSILAGAQRASVSLQSLLSGPQTFWILSENLRCWVSCPPEQRFSNFSWAEPQRRPRNKTLLATPTCSFQCSRAGGAGEVTFLMGSRWCWCCWPRGSPARTSASVSVHSFFQALPLISSWNFNPCLVSIFSAFMTKYG